MTTGPLVLVCGSRSWRNEGMVRERLVRLPRGTRIIHGGARGADEIAARVARSLGIPERAFLADWRSGKQAGLVRNLAMLDQLPDRVLAFWDGYSTGTLHTLTVARARGIEVEVIRKP